MVKLYQDSEKFIKDIFWSKSHNKDNTLNIPDVVAQKLVHDNENKDPEYYNHRPGVVHVTSLQKCLRGVVHEMLGAQKDNPADARKLGVFKAGNLFEDYIVEALGDKMLDRQTEYVYKYKGIYLTGRDDGTISHDGKLMILENKSVHSDAFWRREKEGTLVATHNQAQLQTYLWLRRILPNVFRWGDDDQPIYTNLSKEELADYKNWDVEMIHDFIKEDNSNLNGIFCYISKDDCTISQAPIKFNQEIIDEVVIPAMDIIAYGYTNKCPEKVPAPTPVTFDDLKHQYQKNWLCTYCDYHSQCAGKGWVAEATAEITRKNKEIQNTMVNKYDTPKTKPTIIVVEPTKEELNNLGI